MKELRLTLQIAAQRALTVAWQAGKAWAEALEARIERDLDAAAREIKVETVDVDNRLFWN